VLIQPAKKRGSQLKFKKLSYGLDNRWFESLQELGIFLFTTASRPVLSRVSFPGGKEAGA
jgi:hypothetical protein